MKGDLSIFSRWLSITFLTIRCGIFGFPVMVLPLLRSIAFSMCSLFDDVQRICDDVNSMSIRFLIFCLILARASDTYHTSSKPSLLWNKASTKNTNLF